MKDKVIEILMDLVPDFEYSDDVKLLDDGILDSFDIVNLVLEINEEFGVEIGVEDVSEENFETVDSICELIKEKLEY
ncbi:MULTISPECIES: acyl carrier protein [Peptoniphilus]|uniref:Putative D-alanine--poly(Phosphoribitol) ligase, subunit 2 n=1 Tax=Peptoniphilus duerdenii ATCC BAA-1640 TaxID=862517 RepID=E0NNJ5_9FIRM|nr:MULTISPECIES: phosphopantetheine-binding protein [Peptoniphilus]EFM24598.1 putative D-alanine--poly(phosphoribitol) ligase, subunit 2 [Peptoniphilus duerdenii ATCC BAA-1640]ERT64896.1 putative D-alanine--poly(phosphoribitol) ligase, subunit 2 [Peptoniphilus sp. BV3AC2]MDK8275749.1 phosphopantetheine-binding protein [Peptoniphilus duerdenii]